MTNEIKLDEAALKKAAYCLWLRYNPNTQIGLKQWLDSEYIFQEPCIEKARIAALVYLTETKLLEKLKAAEEGLDLILAQAHFLISRIEDGAESVPQRARDIKDKAKQTLKTIRGNDDR